MSRDYNVGKGKPPQETRFRKGQSGNPNGRPRKSVSTRNGSDTEADTDVDRAMLRASSRAVKMTVDGVVTNVPANAALQMARLQQALGGNRIAGKEVSQEVRAAGAAQEQVKRAKYEFWRDYQRKCRSFLKANPSSGRIFPHPDDIVIDPICLTVTFIGPMEPEELPLFRLALLARDLCLAEAVLCSCHAGCDSKLTTNLLRAAVWAQARIAPSLGGASPFDPPSRNLHSLVGQVMELHLMPSKRLQAQTSLWHETFASCAHQMALGPMSRLIVDASQHADQVGEARMRSRSKIAQDAEGRAIVHALIAEGSSMEQLAEALGNRGISRSAVTRYVRQYQIQTMHIQQCMDDEAVRSPRSSRGRRALAPSLAALLSIVEQAVDIAGSRDVEAKEAMLRARPIKKNSVPQPRGASAETLDIIRREILGIQ